FKTSRKHLKFSLTEVWQVKLPSQIQELINLFLSHDNQAHCYNEVHDTLQVKLLSEPFKKTAMSLSIKTKRDLAKSL
ncbi:hypothetical protein K3F58_18785, partial [Acinetobacter nosocomialis]|nr:hypothetical protein [Acinetobacter nosocomialis]